jgi:predicted RNase H-like HicB family nuclease
MRYTVILTQGEDGWVVAEAPALPGCISQGKTREEAIVNISDAIEGYLQSLRQHGEPIPAEDSIQIQVAA